MLVYTRECIAIFYFCFYILLFFKDVGGEGLNGCQDTRTLVMAHIESLE